ncbi:hypothetical protein HA466_0199050 [Hirschfeldia incana]|nr:hypothetical protein HA466_0199050 [Hirschfeldia incana]KAJ0243923.1 hypothetical protein HA466_0199050 [Hirschfeldia incana]
MRLVIKRKSVEYMPFLLSLLVFLCGTSWFIYGLIGRDVFVAEISAENAGIFKLLVGKLMNYVHQTPQGWQLFSIKSLSLFTGSKPVDSSSRKLGSYLIQSQFQV